MGAKKRKGKKGKAKKGLDIAKLMKQIAETPKEQLIKENIMETIGQEWIQLHLEDFENTNK